MSKTSDEQDIRSVAEKTAMPVMLGEPDPELFAIPEGFREVAPSTLAQEAARMQNAPPPSDDTVKKLAPLDETYWRSRQNTAK